jgi:hypothetical protein
VILTPDDCLALAREMNAIGQPILLQPLVGGLAPEEGWRSLELFTEKVLPRLVGN